MIPTTAATALACASLPVVLLLALALIDFLLFKPLRRPAKRSKTLGNVRFSKSKLPEELDAVIIGSGQAGLSCASVLAQYGQRVVVFEQHEVTGGGAHCFAVDGKSKWRFDAGHHITIPWHEQVLHLACGTADVPVPFDMVADFTDDGFSDRITLGQAPDGESPLPIREIDQLTAELKRRFPAHTAQIDRYMALAESVQMRFGILTAASILPMWLRQRLLRSNFMRLWRKWAGMTGAEGLEEIFPGNEEATCRLRSYLAGLWLDAGSPPSRGSFFMQTAVMGGWQKLGEAYPRGGPQNTALAMVETIEQRGGKVFVRAPVAAILRDAHGAACGVRLTSGDEIKAPKVISAVGYRATEALLNAPAALPEPPPLQTSQSAGFVMANVALKGTLKELGISSAHVWIQPANATNGYDALAGEREYFRDPLGCDLSLVPVGIVFPSAKGGEESDCHTCQILTLAEKSWFSKHEPTDPVALDQNGSRHAPPHVPRKEQATYDEVKKQWAERLVALLHKTFPGTKDRTVFTDLSTPLTLETYLRAHEGAGVGLDVTPNRFVSEAELGELDMKHPRVANLWRCGQDYLMVGQVLAAASGIVCALRQLGPLAAMRFVPRALRLVLTGKRA